MNLNKNHYPRRALALLLTLVMCVGMIPTAFAAQQNSYHDPAEHWMQASGRTNELDANSVVTRETFKCGECGKATSFEVFRVPEYTRNGQPALSRNVKYSDGTMVDGVGKGDTMDGIPGKDATYTGYHYTKAVCETCGGINTNMGKSEYGYLKNVYWLYDCAAAFTQELDENVSYEYTDDTYHTVTTKGGTYCAFCYGTDHAVRLLKANGIGVYFEKENINTLTESSEFLITLFSGFAQAESESLSKNVAWGKQKSAEVGKVTFQYKKMLGYRKGADGQPEIVPEEAEIIRRIYHRYLDGCTLGQIKRELEEDGVPTAQGVERWSPSIIHNILTNEKYIGDALLQKTYVTDCITKKVKKNRGERTMYYVENSHPAIVARDLFNQVQQEMTRRSSKRKVLQKSGKTELGKYSGKYALTELLVCGECGSPYKRVTWARNGKKRIVWRCVSRLEFGTKYCQHSPTLDEGRLHSAILAAMNEYAAIRQEVCPDVLAMAEEAKQALSQAGARLLQLKKRMDAVSREQSDVLDRLLVNMADTELNARMKALTDEKESLKAQIADAQQAEVDLEEQAARRRQMWDSIMECAAGYTEFDNELVRQVIQKITVEDAETIHIHFRDSDVVLEQEVE